MSMELLSCHVMSCHVMSCHLVSYCSAILYVARVLTALRLNCVMRHSSIVHVYVDADSHAHACVPVAFAVAFAAK